MTSLLLHTPNPPTFSPPPPLIVVINYGLKQVFVSPPIPGQAPQIYFRRSRRRSCRLSRIRVGGWLGGLCELGAGGFWQNASCWVAGEDVRMILAQANRFSNQATLNASAGFWMYPSRSPFVCVVFRGYLSGKPNARSDPSDPCEEYISEVLDRVNEKIIIFAHHQNLSCNQ